MPIDPNGCIKEDRLFSFAELAVRENVKNRKACWKECYDLSGCLYFTFYKQSKQRQLRAISYERIVEGAVSAAKACLLEEEEEHVVNTYESCVSREEAGKIQVKDHTLL